MSYFQGKDNVLRVTTCSKELGCGVFGHTNQARYIPKVHWAWDRGLGAWVHYAA